MPVPILAAVRSPFAVADGALAGWHPVDLAAEVTAVAGERAAVDPGAIDGVWVGCDEPVGAQGANAARAVVLAAGWPETIVGTVVEAAPHSGMSALAAACDAISAGRVGTAVVVGMSSASIVQPGASALGRTYGRPWGEGPAARYADVGGLVPPIVAADRAAAQYGIDRAAHDAFGRRSCERRNASSGGIVPVGARPSDAAAIQRGTPIISDQVRSLPTHDLEPIFEVDGATTALSFAPAADGVSVLILGSGDAIGEIVSTGTTAGAPLDPAAPFARLHAAGHRHADRLDLAVASASIALVALEAAGLTPDDVDRDGGTIAVGDAAAAEDLRLIIDGLHRDGGDRTGAAVRLSAGAAAGCVWQRL